MTFVPCYHLLVDKEAQKLSYEPISENHIGILYIIAGKIHIPKMEPLIVTGLDDLVRLTPNEQLTKLADILYNSLQSLSTAIYDNAIPFLITAPSATIKWDPAPILQILDYGYDKKLPLIRLFRRPPKKIAEDHAYVQPPL